MPLPHLEIRTSDNLIMVLEKVLKSDRVTFAQALEEKYCQQEDLVDVFYEPKDSKISTEIAFIGFDKVARAQKQLSLLTSIDLSGKNITASKGFADSLLKGVKNVKTLNLDNNQLGWADLVSIIDYLPNLKELIASRNNLSTCNYQDLSQGRTTRTISSLTLGNTTSDWTSLIHTLAKIWKSVESIDLWNSELTPEKMVLETNMDSVYSMISHFQSIRLSHNHFIQLDWLVKIGPIEHLKELDVSNCHLKTINVDAEFITRLSSLENLNISYNDISDWDLISSLHLLPSLANLICHHNPFMMSEKFSKPMIIGRLGRMRFINREEVTPRIRTDSEILYLRKTFPEFHQLSVVEKAKFLKRHPRLLELVDLYGAPDLPNKDKPVSKYINVQLCFSNSQVIKRLPSDMRISNLRTLCKLLFKLKPSCHLRLMCLDPTKPKEKDIKYELDRDAQTLSFFSVVEGCQILIENSS